MKLLNDMFTLIDTADGVDGGFVCRVMLNPAHFIYRLHFPGNPITPGVCLVQMTTEILEEQMQRQLFLARIANIKVLNTLTPNREEPVSFDFHKLSTAPDECKVQLVISDAIQIYAKLSLTYSYERL
jgi:3-hydroxyacyl-[acyl-carrier-protein] dehydratase